MGDCSRQFSTPLERSYFTELTHLARNACPPAQHHRSVHPPHVRRTALALIDQGINDCEIARRTGIPRSTVRDWRRPPYRRKPLQAACPRCWRGTRPIRFTAEDYAELLGLYLGDGCISVLPRTAQLRIFLDAKYPDIIQNTKALLRRSFPENPVGVVQGCGGTMFVVWVYSSHLVCLFPQWAGGKKARASSCSRLGNDA